MSPTDHALRVTGPRDRLLDALARRLPVVGLEGVLADLDRAAEVCAVPGVVAGEGLTWEPRDRDDESWYPQGVACRDSGRVLLVSWYATRRWPRPSPGSRISVIDRTDPQRPRYRHVELVAPRRRFGVGPVSLGAVRVHAGGIAVQGELLYVADTVAGVRVFRLGDVARVPAGDFADGDDYVLPQWLRLRAPLPRGPGLLRHSFLFVGQVQGRLSLVVGEYRRAGHAPRLVRYPLDPATGLPELGDDGRCLPLEVHERQPPRMQGVAVHGPTWYVSASTGKGNPGDLHVGAPGRWTRHRGVLPTGPEDLDWSHPGEELWCVSEWPGRRWVFPIDVGALRSPSAAPDHAGPRTS